MATKPESDQVDCGCHGNLVAPHLRFLKAVFEPQFPHRTAGHLHSGILSRGQVSSAMHYFVLLWANSDFC